MTALLSVRDLHVGFGRDPRANEVVKGVSFDLEAGRTLAIVGESGSGKSVTALSVNRLVDFGGGRITGGSITLQRDDGTRLDLAAADERMLRHIRGRDIGMIFQEPMTSLNPVHTVGRQIEEAFRLNRGLSGGEARNAAREALERVRIPDAASRLGYYPHQLSGGMRQRVMIAMALACDPKVLVADEPTTALDVTIQAGILDLMRDIRRRLGTAIVLITHNLGVVADVADRVLVMYAGRLAEEAPVGDLFAEPQHPYTIGLLGAIPRPGAADEQGRLREIPGRVPSLAELPTACAFAPRCPRADELSLSQVPELREIEPRHLVACFHPGPGAEAA